LPTPSTFQVLPLSFVTNAVTHSVIPHLVKLDVLSAHLRSIHTQSGTELASGLIASF
jgi:hypothetical protein